MSITLYFDFEGCRGSPICVEALGSDTFTELKKEVAVGMEIVEEDVDLLVAGRKVEGWEKVEDVGLCMGEEVRVVESVGFEARKALRERGVVGGYLEAFKARDDLEVTRLMILADADFVTLTDPAGCTALHHAAIIGDIPTAELLLSHGACPSAADATGVTPLHFTICPRFAATLLRHGAHPDAPSHDGTTPLMVSSQEQCLPMVKLLASHGASVAAVNSKGQSAVDMARLFDEEGATYDFLASL